MQQKMIDESSFHIGDNYIKEEDLKLVLESFEV